MHLTVYFATKGLWKSFRFVCPSCGHVAVAKAFGVAEAAGLFGRMASAEAEGEALKDAARVLEVAAYPRCNRRDDAKLRHYEGWRRRLIAKMVVAGLVFGGAMVLMAPQGLSVAAATIIMACILVPAFSLGTWQTIARRKGVPSAVARVVFPANDEGANQGAAALTVPPLVCYDALFLCATCRETAATLMLREGTLELRGFVEDVDERIAATDLEPLVAGLSINNPKELFATDPGRVPFFCPACEASYCSAHWDLRVVADATSLPEDAPTRDEVDEVDSVDGWCPAGHARKLTS